MPSISSQGWTLDELVAGDSNLERATVVDSTLATDELVKKVNTLLDAGLPVIVSGYDQHPGWDSELFTLKRIRSEFRDSETLARNVVNDTESKIEFSRFLKNVDKVSDFADPEEHVRYYAKDIDAPEPWKRWLNGSRKGRTSVLPTEFLPLGSDDLFAHLPKDAAPESLLCYFGPGDAYTSWYKDPSGSFGQNLMCHTAPNASAFWFMVASGDVDRASSYFHQQGHELDRDDPAPPFLLPEQLRNLPFKVHVCQQKRGDLVILPPRCSHQVIHHGGLSGSLAWSRMTVSSIAHALHLELPIYNRLARPEVYRVKLTLWYATLHEAALPAPNAALLAELLDLLDQVIMAEWTPGVYDLKPSAIFGEDFLTCDYCAADIFVSYFECAACGKEDGLALCPLCYASGRTCRCVTGMKPCVTASFKDIVDQRNECARVLTNLRVRTPEMVKRRIEKSSVLKTFDAASTIHRRRRLSELYMCRLGEGAHQVAAADAVAYDDGLTFGCFTHLHTSSAMHSARAASMSCDAVSAGPNGDDNAGNYLSAVVRKYRQPGCLDPTTTRAGWYDTATAEHEEDDAAQEDLAALIAADIRTIVDSARKTSPQSLPGASAAASEDSPSPSCSTHPASTIVESTTARSQTLSPSPTTESISLPATDAAGPPAEPAPLLSPPAPASSKPEPRRVAQRPVPRKRVASSQAPLVKKASKSTKHNPIVVDSDDDEPGGSVPAPTKKAPVQNRVASGSKRARSDASGAPVTKRRKVAATDASPQEAKTLSYAELMAQAMGKARNHDPLATSSPTAVSTTVSTSPRLHRTSTSSSQSAASASTSDARASSVAARQDSQPSLPTTGSSPQTAHSTPPPPYSNGAASGAQTPAQVAAQTPVQVAAQDVPMSAEPVPNVPPVQRSAAVPDPDSLAVVPAPRPPTPSQAPLPLPPPPPPATQPQTTELSIVPVRARPKAPLPKFTKKRVNEEDGSSSSSDARPLKQPRLHAPEGAQSAGQLESSLIKYAFDTLGHALTQKGERDERLSQLVDALAAVQASDSQQRARCAELEARCAGLEYQLQISRDTLGGQLQVTKDQLAIARRDSERMAVELQSTRQDLGSQLQDARNKMDAMQQGNQKLMQQMVRLKAGLVHHSNEDTNTAPAVVHLEQHTRLPPWRDPTQSMPQPHQARPQWDEQNRPRQYFPAYNPGRQAQNIPYNRHYDRHAPAMSSGEQSGWAPGFANRGRNAHGVANRHGAPYVRREAQGGARLFRQAYNATGWHNRPLERRSWPEDSQEKPADPNIPLAARDDLQAAWKEGQSSPMRGRTMTRGASPRVQARSLSRHSSRSPRMRSPAYGRFTRPRPSSRSPSPARLHTRSRSRSSSRSRSRSRCRSRSRSRSLSRPRTRSRSRSSSRPLSRSPPYQSRSPSRSGSPRRSHSRSLSRQRSRSWSRPARGFHESHTPSTATHVADGPRTPLGSPTPRRDLQREWTMREESALSRQVDNYKVASRRHEVST